jgi:hypothetical protein
MIHERWIQGRSVGVDPYTRSGSTWIWTCAGCGMSVVSFCEPRAGSTKGEDVIWATGRNRVVTMLRGPLYPADCDVSLVQRIMEE